MKTKLQKLADRMTAIQKAAGIPVEWTIADIKELCNDVKTGQYGDWIETGFFRFMKTNKGIKVTCTYNFRLSNTEVEK